MVFFALSVGCPVLIKSLLEGFSRDGSREETTTRESEFSFGVASDLSLTYVLLSHWTITNVVVIQITEHALVAPRWAPRGGSELLPPE
jgi:hypothetical protein